MLWKITILLWVLFLIAKIFVENTISKEEQVKIAFGGHADLTPGRILFVILFLASIAMSVVTLIWLLFFRL